MKSLLSLAVMLVSMLATQAGIVQEKVLYRSGDTELEGLRVLDDSLSGNRPGVLIIHQWKGLGAYEAKRAEMLAKLGYVVFAADIYGKGVRPAAPAEAAKHAGKFKGDRDLLRERAKAALEQLKKSPGVDAGKTAAIGYCFGGTAALELARAGADVSGVVSFHGGLSSPKPEDAKQIKGKVLVLHGADDPHVPGDEVGAFAKEMREAKVDWQMVGYGGAVHSFTDWNAGNDNSKGAAYNKTADERSWNHMKQFFAELFGTR